MKVPIMYKSSERYKAGTDIVYDDGSKLQYPPFIYAATESGDSGGDDEEGEDTMVVKYDSITEHYDKTWQEVKDAALAGKTVMLILDISNEGEDPYTAFDIYYLTEITVDTEENEYGAAFLGAYDSVHLDGEPPIDFHVPMAIFTLVDSPSDYLVNFISG